MKIVGLISSPNINGSGAALLREALKGAQQQGAATAEIFLPAHKLEFCNGCMKCMSDGDCFHPDGFNALRNTLAEADGIILCSPTYAGSFNAVMKVLIERLGMFERFTSNVFGGKYFAAISTCASMGAKKTANEMAGLSRLSLFKRGFVSGTLGVSVGGKDISKDPGALKKAFELGRKISLDIKNNRAYPLQNLPNRIINHIFLKPSFRGVIRKMKEGRMRAVYHNLRENNLI